MVSQDLIYSVLPRPLGNQVSSVKQDVKQVSETAKLKPKEEDEQAVELYHGQDRRKSRRERRQQDERPPKKEQTTQDDDPNEGGLDLYV